MKSYNRKPKLLKAVNVYNINVTNGIGDYIRGCFCMLQILTRLNIPFDMDVSTHPVHKWLQPGPTYNKKVEEFHHDHIYKDRAKLIKHWLSKADGIFTFFTNEYPLYPITFKERLFIQNKLLPSNVMKLYVQETKDKWGVSGPYNIIHLRCGDECLINGKPPNYDLFINAIQQIKLNSYPYIILSDSYQMKLHLHKLYPSFILSNDVPVHTSHTNEEQVKDTMRDFFLFTSATQVYSFSVYAHGSGFSEWACQLYNVPYHAKYLHN